MVTKRLLSDEQIEEVQTFLVERGKMTQNIRTLRSFCNKTDLDQLEYELILLKQLKEAVVKMGRPLDKTVSGTFTVRHPP